MLLPTAPPSGSVPFEIFQIDSHLCHSVYLHFHKAHRFSKFVNVSIDLEITYQISDDCFPAIKLISLDSFMIPQSKIRNLFCFTSHPALYRTRRHSISNDFNFYTTNNFIGLIQLKHHVRSQTLEMLADMS